MDKLIKKCNKLKNHFDTKKRMSDEDLKSHNRTPSCREYNENVADGTIIFSHDKIISTTKQQSETIKNTN